MPDFFSHSDALLVTLSSNPIFSYTIPGKIQSYLACGKPIIAAIDGEGARIVKESGSGISVGSGDYKSLAKAARTLSEMNKKDILKKGKLARIFYENNFNRFNLISQIEDIIIKNKTL